MLVWHRHSCRYLIPPEGRFRTGRSACATQFLAPMRHLSLGAEGGIRFLFEIAFSTQHSALVPWPGSAVAMTWRLEQFYLCQIAPEVAWLNADG